MVERLPQQELETFVAQIVALRAQRTAPHLSQEETALLLQINAGISPNVQRCFSQLVAKRQAEIMTPSAPAVSSPPSSTTHSPGSPSTSREVARRPAAASVSAVPSSGR